MDAVRAERDALRSVVRRLHYDGWDLVSISTDGGETFEPHHWADADDPYGSRAPEPITPAEAAAVRNAAAVPPDSTSEDDQ